MAFSTYLADTILNWIKGTAFPAGLANVYISIHGANPGSTGSGSDLTLTITGSANRTSILTSSFSVPSNATGGGREITNGGVVLITGSAVNGTVETVTHFGVWDAVTGGNFLASGVLVTPVSIQNGDTVQFNVGALAIRCL